MQHKRKHLNGYFVPQIKISSMYFKIQNTKDNIPIYIIRTVNKYRDFNEVNGEVRVRYMLRFAKV